MRRIPLPIENSRQDHEHAQVRRLNARAFRRKTRPTGRPATTRTVSPYFSPDIQIAPVCLASSIGSSRVITGESSRIISLTRAATACLCSGESAPAGLAKIETHAIDAHPRTGLRRPRRRARLAARAATDAPTCDGAESRAATNRRPRRARAPPTANSPLFTTPWCATASPMYCVSSTSKTEPSSSVSRAAVADLAAAFGIKRRAIEDHDAAFARGSVCDRLVVLAASRRPRRRLPDRRSR